VERLNTGMLYTDEELQRIYQAMRPGTLLVPMVQQTTGSAPSLGPRFMVFRLHSELGLEPTDCEAAYWNALQQADITDGVGEMSWINANLSEARATEPQVHLELARRFVEPAILERIGRQTLQGGAASVVFNRIGCLLSIRHLMLFGGTQPQPWNAFKVGRLALLANDFVQNTPIPKKPTLSSLDVLLFMAPTWDVYNSRNLGHGMSRIFTMLTEILRGDDPTVKKLIAQLKIVPDKIEIDGFPLYQFSAVVFALFAYARAQEAQGNAQVKVLFDPNEIFAQTGCPYEVLERFVDARGRTLEGFRELLSNGKPRSQEAFLDELKRRAFLTESLNVFRTYPLFKLDAERVVMLDVQFVVELLTSGVYWGIYDALPPTKRPTFKELWGRMFELYVVSLLSQFYPPFSGMLSSDVAYDGGQIDALLDFGHYVLVFEVKSSLLTEPAKRSADKDSFLADFRLKFVENKKGNPKTIKQLAGICRAILSGEIPTAKTSDPPIVYPIFVSDEPAVEATFMNAFFHEEFQKEGIKDTRVKPMTVMTIDELEQTLSYVTDNDFSWEELLNSRFNEFGVSPNSVGQAIYALIVQKGLAAKQNPALKRKYDEFGDEMRKVFYKSPERGED
jgi:hypothetical protein